VPNVEYFEDYEIGQTFETHEIVVTDAAIEAFLEYDPQPYHRPETAPSTRFGRLVASGWQTAGYTMRLMVDGGVLPPSGGIGVGVESMRWVRPVYPGDSLHVVARVESLKAAPQKPNGLVRLRVWTRNQHGEDVMTLLTTTLVDRRAPSPEPHG
jgi:acyl dehydratase